MNLILSPLLVLCDSIGYPINRLYAKQVRLGHWHVEAGLTSVRVQELLDQGFYPLKEIVADPQAIKEGDWVGAVGQDSYFKKAIKSLGLRIWIFLNGLSVNKSASPVTITSALPAKAMSRIKLSLASRHIFVLWNGLTNKASILISRLNFLILSAVKYFLSFGLRIAVWISFNRASATRGVKRLVTKALNNWREVGLVPMTALIMTLVSTTALMFFGMAGATDVLANGGYFTITNGRFLGTFTDIIHQWLPALLAGFALKALYDAQFLGSRQAVERVFDDIKRQIRINFKHGNNLLVDLSVIRPPQAVKASLFLRGLFGRTGLVCSLCLGTESTKAFTNINTMLLITGLSLISIVGWFLYAGQIILPILDTQSWVLLMTLGILGAANIWAKIKLNQAKSERDVAFKGYFDAREKLELEFAKADSKVPSADETAKAMELFQAALTQGDLKASDFTVMIYPASGSYDARTVVALARLLPQLEEIHLIDFTYACLKEEQSLRTRISKSIPATVKLYTYPKDYLSFRVPVVSTGKRIIIDKLPGIYASLRGDARFYNSILLDSREGDLILIFQGGKIAFKWMKSLGQLGFYKEDGSLPWDIRKRLSQDALAILERTHKPIERLDFNALKVVLTSADFPKLKQLISDEFFKREDHILDKLLKHLRGANDEEDRKEIVAFMRHDRELLLSNEIDAQEYVDRFKKLLLKHEALVAIFFAEELIIIREMKTIELFWSLVNVLHFSSGNPREKSEKLKLALQELREHEAMSSAGLLLFAQVKYYFRMVIPVMMRKLSLEWSGFNLKSMMRVIGVPIILHIAFIQGWYKQILWLRFSGRIVIDEVSLAESMLKAWLIEQGLLKPGDSGLDIPLICMECLRNGYAMPQVVRNEGAIKMDEINIFIYGAISEDHMALAQEAARHQQTNLMIIHDSKWVEFNRRGFSFKYPFIRKAYMFVNDRFTLVHFSNPRPIHYFIDFSRNTLMDRINRLKIPTSGSKHSAAYTEEKDVSMTILGKAGVKVPKGMTLILRSSGDKIIDKHRRESMANVRSLTKEQAVDVDLLTGMVQVFMGFDGGFANGIVIKPNNGRCGQGVLFFTRETISEGVRHIIMLLGQYGQVIIQERIVPPVMSSNEQWKDRSIDYNLRVFVSPDENGKGVVNDMVVRMGDSGKAINLSLGARALSFDAIPSLLGLNEAMANELKRKIELTAESSFNAIHQQMVADGAIKAQGTSTDFMGVDIILNQESDGSIVPYVMEVNDYHSGGMWDLDNALRTYAAWGAEIPQERIGQSSRGYVRTMIRRVRAFKQQDIGNTYSSAVASIFALGVFEYIQAGTLFFAWVAVVYLLVSAKSNAFVALIKSNFEAIKNIFLSKQIDRGSQFGRESDSSLDPRFTNEDRDFVDIHGDVGSVTDHGQGALALGVIDANITGNRGIKDRSTRATIDIRFKFKRFLRAFEVNLYNWIKVVKEFFVGKVNGLAHSKKLLKKNSLVGTVTTIGISLGNFSSAFLRASLPVKSSPWQMITFWRGYFNTSFSKFFVKYASLSRTGLGIRNPPIELTISPALSIVNFVNFFIYGWWKRTVKFETAQVASFMFISFGSISLLMLLGHTATAPPMMPSEATLPLFAAVGMLMPFNKSKTKQEHPVLIPILRRLYRVLTNENRRRLALKISSMIETAFCLIPWTAESWIRQYPLNIQQELQSLRERVLRKGISWDLIVIFYRVFLNWHRDLKYQLWHAKIKENRGVAGQPMPWSPNAVEAALFKAWASTVNSGVPFTVPEEIKARHKVEVIMKPIDSTIRQNVSEFIKGLSARGVHLKDSFETSLYRMLSLPVENVFQHVFSNGGRGWIVGLVDRANDQLRIFVLDSGQGMEMTDVLIGYRARTTKRGLAIASLVKGYELWEPEENWEFNTFVTRQWFYASRNQLFDNESLVLKSPLWPMPNQGAVFGLTLDRLSNLEVESSLVRVGDVSKRIVTVDISRGLHTRPSTALVLFVDYLKKERGIRKVGLRRVSDSELVNIQQVILLLVQAIEPGEQVVIVVEGADESIRNASLDALEWLLTQRIYHQETGDMILESLMKLRFQQALKKHEGSAEHLPAQARQAIVEEIVQGGINTREFLGALCKLGLVAVVNPSAVGSLVNATGLQSSLTVLFRKVNPFALDILIGKARLADDWLSSAPDLGLYGVLNSIRLLAEYREELKVFDPRLAGALFVPVSANERASHQFNGQALATIVREVKAQANLNVFLEASGFSLEDAKYLGAILRNAFPHIEDLNKLLCEELNAVRCICKQFPATDPMRIVVETLHNQGLDTTLQLRELDQLERFFRHNPKAKYDPKKVKNYHGDVFTESVVISPPRACVYKALQALDAYMKASFDINFSYANDFLLLVRSQDQSPRNFQEVDLARMMWIFNFLKIDLNQFVLTMTKTGRLHLEFVPTKEKDEAAKKSIIDVNCGESIRLSQLTGEIPVQIYWVGAKRNLFYEMLIVKLLAGKLSEILKRFNIFNPNSPDTVLLGGRLRQATSTLRIWNPKNWNDGIITTGTHSVPLAVISSILFLDLVGSMPMAITISVGMLVTLAPVSKTILMSLPLLGPRANALTTMMGSLGLNGTIAINQLKSDSVTFWQGLVRKINQGQAFSFNGFFVDFFTLGAVRKQMAADGGCQLSVHLVYLDQEPLMLKTAFNFVNEFRFHIYHLKQSLPSALRDVKLWLLRLLRRTGLVCSLWLGAVVLLILLGHGATAPPELVQNVLHISTELITPLFAAGIVSLQESILSNFKKYLIKLGIAGVVLWVVFGGSILKAGIIVLTAGMLLAINYLLVWWIKKSTKPFSKTNQELIKTTINTLIDRLLLDKSAQERCAIKDVIIAHTYPMNRWHYTVSLKLRLAVAVYILLMVVMYLLNIVNSVAWFISASLLVVMILNLRRRFLESLKKVGGYTFIDDMYLNLAGSNIGEKVTYIVHEAMHKLNRMGFVHNDVIVVNMVDELYADDIDYITSNVADKALKKWIKLSDNPHDRWEKLTKINEFRYLTHWRGMFLKVFEDDDSYGIEGEFLAAIAKHFVKDLRRPQAGWEFARLLSLGANPALAEEYVRKDQTRVLIEALERMHQDKATIIKENCFVKALAQCCSQKALKATINLFSLMMPTIDINPLTNELRFRPLLNELSFMSWLDNLYAKQIRLGHWHVEAGLTPARVQELLDQGFYPLKEIVADPQAIKEGDWVGALPEHRQIGNGPASGMSLIILDEQGLIIPEEITLERTRKVVDIVLASYLVGIELRGNPNRISSDDYRTALMALKTYCEQMPQSEPFWRYVEKLGFQRQELLLFPPAKIAGAGGLMGISVVGKQTTPDVFTYSVLANNDVPRAERVYFMDLLLTQWLRNVGVSDERIKFIFDAWVNGGSSIFHEEWLKVLIKDTRAEIRTMLPKGKVLGASVWERGLIRVKAKEMLSWSIPSEARMIAGNLALDHLRISKEEEDAGKKARLDKFVAAARKHKKERGWGLKQTVEFVYRNFRVLQYPFKRPAIHFAVIRNDQRNFFGWVKHFNVTAALANNMVTRALQGVNHLLAGYKRWLGAHRARFKILWSWVDVRSWGSGSRYKRIASLILAMASVSVLPWLWQPFKEGHEATINPSSPFSSITLTVILGISFAVVTTTIWLKDIILSLVRQARGMASLTPAVWGAWLIALVLLLQLSHGATAPPLMAQALPMMPSKNRDTLTS